MASIARRSLRTTRPWGALSPARFSPASNVGRFFSTTPSRDTTYGFIGLGAMGFPMAVNLRKKIEPNDHMIVHDVNAQSAEKFKSENSAGVSVVKSSSEAAKDSNIVITVLPEPQHVQGVFESILSEKLGATSTGEERLFIDCSTIDVITSRDVASKVTSASAGAFVDAPMSGGVVGARAASLTFMYGANDALKTRVEPILLLLGKRAAHMGGQGNGLAAKLANNYSLAIQQIAIAESMNLGIKLGLDSKALGELISSSSGSSWSSKVNNPVPGVSPGAPAERKYAGGFGINLMRKDLRLAMTAADEARIPLLLASRVRELYDEVSKEDGHPGGGRDFSVVYDWLLKQK